jgi:hypothetical protein
LDTGESPVPRKDSAFFKASSIAVPPMGLRDWTNVWGLVEVGLFRGLQLAEESLRLGGEADDLEAVALVEVLEAEGQGLLRLLHLLAAALGHRAAGVDDEADVALLDLLSPRRAEPGRRHQQEITVVRGVAVREQVDADVCLGTAEQTLKSASGRTFFSSYPIVAARSPSRRHLGLVAGAVDALDRARRRRSSPSPTRPQRRRALNFSVFSG